MKTITFNKKSWHYHLAYKYGGLQPYFDNDLCTYTRKVLKGFMKVLFHIGWMSLAGLFVLLPILHLSIAAWYWTWFEPDGFTIAFEIAWVSAIMAISIVFSIMKLEDKWENRRRKPSKKADSFLTEAYRSFKDKYCVRIQFK